MFIVNANLEQSLATDCLRVHHLRFSFRAAKSLFFILEIAQLERVFDHFLVVNLRVVNVFPDI